MATDFEIATFEYNDLYDGNDRVAPDQVVKTFMQQYKHYFNPEYYAEDNVWFSSGRTWLAYRDKTGGDKPMMVMLMGPITDELVAEIKTTVAKLYIKACPGCGKEMPNVQSTKWEVCAVCREL
jgi:hypothetical protein